MRMHDYLKDKIFTLLAFFLLEIIIISLLILLNANLLLIVYIPILLVIVFTFCLIKDYIKINTFHNNIKKTLQNLDQKTFVAELLEKTDYTEGNQFIDYLYEINKNYNENINKYKYSFEEFKDYIELWCHEIKTPIATTKLIKMIVF